MSLLQSNCSRNLQSLDCTTRGQPERQCATFNGQGCLCGDGPRGRKTRPAQRGHQSKYISVKNTFLLSDKFLRYCQQSANTQHCSIKVGGLYCILSPGSWYYCVRKKNFERFRRDSVRLMPCIPLRVKVSRAVRVGGVKSGRYPAWPTATTLFQTLTA